MLYHLFQYLDRSYDLPGAGMFQYISFRSALAVILALLITITFGQGIIRFMQRRQIGEEIRNLGLEGQLQKRGTPTMGGVMILLAVLVPVLLFGRLDNIYIQLMIVSTVWLGLLGFLDDYIKVFRHNKEGLKGKFKIVGQVGIGIIVGTVMCASPEVVVRDKVVEPVQQLFVDDDGEVIESVTTNRVVMGTESVKTTQTTIPFVKNNEFDYAWFTGGNRVATWILYVLVAIFVVTAALLSFNTDLSNTCIIASLLNELSYIIIFNQLVSEIFFTCNPLRIPIFYNSDSKSVWINFLSHE